MNLVTPELGTIFWMVIIFGIVVLILRKFTWTPILNALGERENNINSALQAADKARKEVENLKADNEKIMAEARKEKEKILHEAMQLKDNIIAEAKQKAEAEGKSNIQHARQQIENEKAKAMYDMKKLVAELSLTIAEKIIRKDLEDDKAQQEMVKKMVDDFKLN